MNLTDHEVYVDEQRHRCGGTLRFVRTSSGASFERCDGCSWFYDFDRSRPTRTEPVSLQPFRPASATALVATGSAGRGAGAIGAAVPDAGQEPAPLPHSLGGAV